MKLETLGDVLGSLVYMGACFLCRIQFMSRYDRVARHASGRLVCERCASRAA